MTYKIIYKMTYNVSNVTLNPTIPVASLVTLVCKLFIIVVHIQLWVESFNYNIFLLYFHVHVYFHFFHFDYSAHFNAVCAQCIFVHCLIEIFLLYL